MHEAMRPGLCFGRWEITVITDTRSDRCLCRCSCGTVREVSANSLRRGTTKSCGCLRKERRTSHGRARSSEYRAWSDMKQRCLNPKHRHYVSYGGRGISVCQRWLDSFDNFLEDVGCKPSSRVSLERVDNSRGYEPKNTAWASQKKQARNTRNNKMVTFGNETLCVAEWAERLALPHATVYARLFKYRWPLVRALTAPLQHTGRGKAR